MVPRCQTRSEPDQGRPAPWRHNGTAEEWAFLTTWYPILADVLALHDGMMRGLGEHAAPLMAGGRDRLESAIAAPQWASLHADADLADQAALIAIRIAQAHALVDNNKRLAYIVGVIFLRENGHPLPAEHAMAFAKKIEAALESSATVTSVAGWLRAIVSAPEA